MSEAIVGDYYVCAQCGATVHTSMVHLCQARPIENYNPPATWPGYYDSQVIEALKRIEALLEELVYLKKTQP